MTTTGVFCCFDNRTTHPLPITDKEHQPTVSCYSFYNLCCSPKVGSGDFKGDDVDALSDTEDVALIARVPK
jgi:hypothetical protein